MTDAPVDAVMVGLFWVVEERGSATLIAHAVSLAQAVPYGDMLTIEAGHFEHWSELARRGVPALRKAGIPTVPVWTQAWIKSLRLLQMIAP